MMDNDKNNKENFVKDYINELEEKLKESRNQYNSLKHAIKDRGIDYKIYRETFSRFMKALGIIEGKRTRGGNKLLSYIYEMDLISSESEQIVESFRDNEEIYNKIYSEENKEKFASKKENVDNVIKMLEDIVVLGEDVLKTMGGGYYFDDDDFEGFNLEDLKNLHFEDVTLEDDNVDDESKELDNQIEELNMRIELLNENEMILEKLEKSLDSYNNKSMEVEMECNASNDMEVTNDKLSDLVEKLNLETTKNAEVEYEFEELNAKVEELDSLYSQIQILKTFNEMNISDFKDQNICEIFEDFPSLKEEILKFNDGMMEIEEKRANYKIAIAETELSHNEKLNELNELTLKKKDLLKTINYLRNEIERLKEETGDKAYILDGIILDKLKLESTLLEECANLTKEIENEKKK